MLRCLRLGLTLWRHRRQHDVVDPPLCLGAALLQLMKRRPQPIHDVRVCLRLPNLLLGELVPKAFSELNRGW